MTARTLRALLISLAVYSLAGACLPARAGRIARLTHYEATGSPMATGLYPFIGAAACSYDLPLYTYVYVGGDLYQCLDRGLLGDGSAFTWLDLYSVNAEALYGPWAEITVAQ